MYKYCKRLKTNNNYGAGITPVPFQINFMYLIIIDPVQRRAYRTKFSKKDIESWSDRGEEAVYLLGFDPSVASWIITEEPNVITL